MAIDVTMFCVWIKVRVGGPRLAGFNETHPNRKFGMALFTRMIFSSCMVVFTAMVLPCVQADEAEEHGLWLRHTVSLKSDSQQQTHLRLAANGVVSLYVNGQRLARNENLSDPPTVLQWDITSLVRDGVNSVAVSVSGNDSSGTSVRCWLKTGKQADVLLSSWKSTDQIPPVGWQQTDFNDRDWKAATVSVEVADLADRVRRDVNWEKSLNGSRVTNGQLSFRDGDHVVLVGGTFIERAQQYGHLECALNRDPSVNVTFRNLGWSADTVWAESRGIFDAPEKGYERLIEHIRAEEPTVVVLCYGQNEALSLPAGTESIERFKQQLRKLQADVATTGAEVIFLSPHPFFAMSEPLPDPTRWNPLIADYVDAVREVATNAGSPFVDLFRDFAQDTVAAVKPLNLPVNLPPSLDEHPEMAQMLYSSWTDNGMHFNDVGYAVASYVLQARLFGTKSEGPVVELDPEATTITATGAETRNLRWSPSTNRLVQFEIKADSVAPDAIRIIVKDMTSRYRATLQPINTASEQLPSVLRVGQSAENGHSYLEFTTSGRPDYETLRELTIRKNELYFHRWRPQNITYLYGFRKHEQGNNASEIALFDPLVDELETQIQQARQPAWHQVVIELLD